MKLFIGNKNYSSWSLRAWLAMRVKNIEFQEELRPFNVDNDFKDFFEFSPSGKVPVLHDNTTIIWDSLAILEYLAEKFPEKNLWPEDSALRAEARSIANEMHAGFLALRESCPMNMRRATGQIIISEAVLKDVKRIENIWGSCLENHGGPFLFGEFCIADAMYAPVVNRLHIYQLSSAPAVQEYTQAITSIVAWQQWAEASKKEPWVVYIDEA